MTRFRMYSVRALQEDRDMICSLALIVDINYQSFHTSLTCHTHGSITVPHELDTYLGLVCEPNSDLVFSSD